MEKALQRAKELLRTVRHVPIATVNIDGSPHNSPVFAAFDTRAAMIWASHPDTQHSRNIQRQQQVYLVLFDSMEKGGGLFMQCRAGEVPETELDTALQQFNVARRRHLHEEVPRQYFTGSAPQRLYRAEPLKLWVNQSDKDEAGYIIRDKKYEISLEDLLA